MGDLISIARVAASDNLTLEDYLQAVREDQDAELRWLREERTALTRLVEHDQRERARQTSPPPVARSRAELAERELRDSVRHHRTVEERLLARIRVLEGKLHDLQAHARRRAENAPDGDVHPHHGFSLHTHLRDEKRRLCTEALQIAAANRTEAARLLGLGRTTYVEMCKSLRIFGRT